MSLNAFLFQRPFNEEGQTLFGSQSELAAEVVQHTKPRAKSPTKDPENVRAFINQVLHGTRKAPDELREGVKEAVRSRLKEMKFKPALIDRTLQRLDEEFEIGVAPRDEPLDDRQEFASLDAEAEIATVHYILTIIPAEIKENKKAEILKADLVERLGLVPAWAHMKKRGIQYVFNLPDARTGSFLWRNLRHHLVASWRLNVSDAVKGLRAACDARKLLIRIVPPEFCIPPLVVFDPTENRRGFVLEYQGSTAVSVARLSGDTLGWWYRDVYVALGGTGPAERVTELKHEELERA